MDHRQFLQSLPAETRRELHERSDRAGLVALALHLGLIAGLGAAVALQVPFWPVLMLPLGIALAFTFTLQHECTHKTPFATPWLNEVAGHLCALLLVQPFLWFRYFHLAHHRFTHDPDRDPELQGAVKPESWPGIIRHLSALGYWRAKAAVLWRNAFATPRGGWFPAATLPRLRREARLLLAAYALAATSLLVTPLLLYVWLIPLALGFPFLRLYLLAEHGRCAHVADMFANSRTVFTNAAMRFLAWNMPYHSAHHAAPNVPFHRLAALTVLIREHLKETEAGYARFTRHYVAGFASPPKPPRTAASQ